MLEAEIKQTINSSDTFLKDGWIVKYSNVYENFVLILISRYTRQTLIRYFDSEMKASSFISKVLNSDAKQEYLEKPKNNT